MRRDVYQAIADPVRRDIIDLLSKEGRGGTIREANTFPGCKGVEKASGVNVAGSIFEVMQSRLEKSGGISRKEMKEAATHEGVTTRH